MKTVTTNCRWCSGEDLDCEVCAGTNIQEIDATLDYRTEKQEEIVSALYEFARGLKDNPPDIVSSSESGVHTIHGASVRQAAERIMVLFGLQPVEIQ